MRLPRLRFRIWWLMTVVAVVAVIAALLVIISRYDSEPIIQEAPVIPEAPGP